MEQKSRKKNLPTMTRYNAGFLYCNQRNFKSKLESITKYADQANILTI